MVCFGGLKWKIEGRPDKDWLWLPRECWGVVGFKTRFDARRGRFN